MKVNKRKNWNGREVEGLKWKKKIVVIGIVMKMCKVLEGKFVIVQKKKPYFKVYNRT